MLEFYVDSLITIHFFNYHGGVIISDLMINGQIRDKEVRLIANDGEQLGVMSAREAQKLADEAGLDLVKISPKAKPPVCKIIDYGKYKYEQTRKEKLAKKEQEIQDLKKEAEKHREKTEAASRETKVVLEEKSIQTAEGLQKSKRRMLGIAMLGKKVPKSVVEKILEYNLSAEQLEEIRQCVESGLADAEILQVMENSPSPERMKKMREIILLMRKRKAGV